MMQSNCIWLQIAYNISETNIVNSCNAVLVIFTALHRGKLHLQRASAGWRIQSLPLLSSWTTCVPRIKALPGATRAPVHQVPAHEEHLDAGTAGGGGCVWLWTHHGGQAALPPGFRRPSRDGPRVCSQSSVLYGQQKMRTEVAASRGCPWCENYFRLTFRADGQ